MKKIKRLTAAILATSLLFLCTACATEPSEQNNLQQYEETTTEPTNVYENTTIPETTTQKSLSEYGFYNIDEMGNILIEINGYDFSGDDPYVYYDSDYSGKIWQFKNGYCYAGRVNEENKIVMDNIIGTYTIVDNDTVYCYSSDEGNGTLMLTDRKVFSDFDTVIFTLINNGNEDGWLIPYSAIDWEKGFCEVEQKDSYWGGATTTYFKLYLKQ